MGTKKDTIQELTYSIEALEDEVETLEAKVEHLNEMVAVKQSRIAELITENDRLTLTYEPYIPPKAKKSLRERLFKSPRFAGDVAFDYWPPSDWWRFNVSQYRKGQYFQACIGPIRVEFYAS